MVVPPGISPPGLQLVLLQPLDLGRPRFLGEFREQGPFCSFHTRLGLRPKSTMALAGPGHWGGSIQARLRRVHRPWAVVTGTKAYWMRERRCWDQLGVTPGLTLLCRQGRFLWVPAECEGASGGPAEGGAVPCEAPRGRVGLWELRPRPQPPLATCSVSCFPGLFVDVVLKTVGKLPWKWRLWLARAFRRNRNLLRRFCRHFSQSWARSQGLSGLLKSDDCQFPFGRSFNLFAWKKSSSYSRGISADVT